MVSKTELDAPEASDKEISGFDRWFEITKRGSTTGREVRGGLVTFFSMAYIIVLNPAIIGNVTDINGKLISGASPDEPGAVAASMAMVAVATCLVSGILTMLMGAWGRYPIGISAGLGLNAMAAYIFAPQMTWAQAMGLFVWEGLLITILVLSGVREAIFKAVPNALRTAISVGIGLFITLVGLLNAGVIRKPVASSTPLELGISGTLRGWPILVFVLTLILLILLFARNVQGAMLISIGVGTVIAIILEATLTIQGETGWAGTAPVIPAAKDFVTPDFGLIGRVDLFGAFAPDGKFEWKVVLGLILMIFSLLLADFFDTMGTVVAVGKEGDLLDEDGNPPHLKEILIVDSIGALAGGLCSTSSNTSFVESASGVAAGARTGVASLVTGGAFLLSIILSPVVKMVPAEAVSPVLVIVGFLMMKQIVEIDWDDVDMALPSFMTIIMMPFAYSITAGIGMGFITLVLVKVFKGKAKQIHLLMWICSVLFVVYFMQGIIVDLLT